jgi:hypothetical protein
MAHSRCADLARENEMTEQRINDMGWIDENHLSVNACGAKRVMIHQGEAVLS